CLGCHTLGGQGGNRAVEWSNVSFRLQPDWVREYLIEPRRFGVAPTNMPALFYRLTDDQQRFEALVARPAERIQLLTDYLFSMNRDKREALDKEFAAARAKFPQANAALGEAIFRSQNCAACHRNKSISPLPAGAAPLLTQEARRVTEGWLTDY